MASLALACAGADRSADGLDASSEVPEVAPDSTGPVPVPPGKARLGQTTIAWLAGTPYEMGRQQGALLHDEIAASVAWLDQAHLLALLPVIEQAGVLQAARDHSLPEVQEECRGLAEVAGEVGYTEDLCLVLAFADALVALMGESTPLLHLLAPGCSQAVAAGEATTDGRLLHARSLDWDAYEVLLRFPTLFVRQPEGGVPHVVLGFPGGVSPFQGMNAEGLVVASNKIDVADAEQLDRAGQSNLQFQGRVLARARSLDEARAIYAEFSPAAASLTVISDGPARRAVILERTPQVLGVREPVDGVLWGTNHFVSPEAAGADEPPSNGSRRRFDRLQQLLDPAGDDSRHGQVDARALVALLKDRVNPWTGAVSPVDTVEDGDSLSTNGAVHQLVFDPEGQRLWFAAGALPVPRQPFVGVSLAALLGRADAEPLEPPLFDGDGAPLDPADCPPPPEPPPPSGFDPSYVPLRSDTPYADRLFYLLTVLEQDPEAHAAVAASAELSELAAVRRTRALAAGTGGVDDPAWLADQLRWTDDEREAAADALAVALAATTVAARHLRASGAFALHDPADDAELVRQAWRDASAGLNRLLDEYALGLGAAWLRAAVPDADQPDAPFYGPLLSLVARALDESGRDEAVRYEPLDLGENAAALATLASTAPSAHPFALIVVPGIGPTTLDEALTEASRQHAATAAGLWRAGLAPVVVPSGGHVHPFPTPYSEAVEMKRYLMDEQGLPESAILIDPYARHTTTNLRNGARLAIRAGVALDRPLLVTTDPLQSIGIHGLDARCREELGAPCWAGLGALTPRDHCWYATPLSLHQDARDPLDP